MDHFETCSLERTKITTGRCKIYQTILDEKKYYLKKVPSHLISREYKVGLLINEIQSPHFMKTIGTVKRNNKFYLITLAVEGKHLSRKRTSQSHIIALKNLYHELLRCSNLYGFTHYDINKSNIIYQPVENGYCAVLIDFGRSYINNPDGWDNYNYQYENGGYIDFIPICPDPFLDLSFFANTLSRNGFESLKTLLPKFDENSPYAYGLELCEIFKIDYWLLAIDPYIDTQVGENLTSLIYRITEEYNMEHQTNYKWYNINKQMLSSRKINEYIQSYSRSLTYYKMCHISHRKPERIQELQNILSYVLSSPDHIS